MTRCDDTSSKGHKESLVRRDCRIGVERRRIRRLGVREASPSVESGPSNDVRSNAGVKPVLPSSRIFCD